MSTGNQHYVSIDEGLPEVEVAFVLDVMVDDEDVYSRSWSSIQDMVGALEEDSLISIEVRRAVRDFQVDKAESLEQK